MLRLILAIFLFNLSLPSLADELRVAHRVVDLTPPLDVEPGGVFREKKPRAYAGIRQPAEARCLVVGVGDRSAAIVSLDLLAVGREFVDELRADIAGRTRIPKDHIRICATHTHSMPTFKLLRMHGDLPTEFMKRSRERIAAAVAEAMKDLRPATLEVGRSRAEGANFNRTSKTWKTDREFDKDSTDADRWVDSTVHVLRFRRDDGDIILYHFSAHPVVFRDDPGAGPDFPGLVNRIVAARHQATASFLQGHCGDINPGDGKTFLGNPEDVAGRVAGAIDEALKGARKVEPKDLVAVTRRFALPLDLDRFRRDIAAFEADPEAAVRKPGWFKNLAFAKEWHAWAKTWDPEKTTYPVELSALRLGDVVLAFHPGELYSGYGLRVRRDSPFALTLVVGYADDLVGYLPDPKAFEQNEYAAVTVPKILSLPPFTTTAASELAAELTSLINEVHRK